MATSISSTQLVRVASRLLTQHLTTLPKAKRASHISPTCLHQTVSFSHTPHTLKTPPIYKTVPSKRPPSKVVQNTEKATIDSIFQQRRIPFIVCGVMAVGFGLYFSMILSSFLKDPCPSCAEHDPASDQPTGRPAAVDFVGDNDAVKRQTAEAFDRGLDVPELLMGLGGLREAIAKTARGKVLEIAVGTGRNLGFYDWTEVVDGLGVDGKDEETAKRERERRVKERVRLAIRTRGQNKGEQQEKFDLEKAKVPGQNEGEVLSYTGVDISADMMGVARSRLRDTVPGLKKLMRKIRKEPMPDRGIVVDVLEGRVRLAIADAEEPLPPPVPVPAAPSGDKYDTIVQSFGLCSVSDPVKLVANMASMVEPGTGRILLLEHGRGRWEFINGLLDSYAPDHFRKYGCWWNRDIEKIVRKAAEKVPGLEIMGIERPLWLQFGTTLVIKMRVNPDAVKKTE